MLKGFKVYSILVGQFLNFVVKFFLVFSVSLTESWGKNTSFFAARTKIKDKGQRSANITCLYSQQKTIIERIYREVVSNLVQNLGGKLNEKKNNNFWIVHSQNGTNKEIL